jgi:serine/threonine protein kinase
LQTNYSGKNSGNLEQHRDDKSEAPPEVSVNDECAADRTPSTSNSSVGKEGTASVGDNLAPSTASELELTRGPSVGEEGAVRYEVGAVVDGKYELLSLLGSGGMSTVYKARHAFMRNIVAVKLLHPRLLTDTLSVKRFQQEARAASRLKHPNAISVHEFGISGGQPYLVMDYLEGVSCAELVKREGKVGLEKSLHIFIQACDALADAHDRGIIHRDLKPSNVMLTKHKDDNCFVKVVDFGIAKIVSEAGGESLKLTSTGEVFGSPLYMSPEQCMGQSLDNRSDIYSMGCLMYEVLTGRTPFTGKNVLETILKQTNEPPPGLGAIDGDVRVVQKLDAIVLKCLAKAPEQRYQSMKDLRSDLESAAQSAVFGWKALAKIGRKATEVERTLARRVGLPKKLTVVAMVALPVLAALAAVFILLFGFGSGLSERQLPIEAVLDRTVNAPSAEDLVKNNNWWSRVEPRLHSPNQNLEILGRKFLTYTDLADRLKANGEYSLAALNYDRAFNLSIPLGLDNSEQAANIFNSRAECQLRAGGSLALKLAKESGLIALGKLDKLGDQATSSALVGHACVAQACYRLGELSEARKHYDQVRDLFLRGAYKKLDGLALANILSYEGRFELEQGNPGKAADIFGPAAGYWSNLGGPALFNLASAQNDLGMAQDLNGNHEEAQKLFESANRILASLDSHNNVYRSKVVLNLSDSYFRSGDWPAALRTRIASLKLRFGIPQI